ncbi:hypothetical protein K0M31_008019 [Melipona bicolor]|uniref:Uncharacterized protein n=1 Tax=Melipona bicolor TaxID=60889 RepID=A0AA40GCI2_9HYME|nr:hypothetical protein K0M31_008019 [Melipona bicolor]
MRSCREATSTPKVNARRSAEKLAAADARRERRTMVPKQKTVRTATVEHGVEAASKRVQADETTWNHVGTVTKMPRGEVSPSRGGKEKIGRGAPGSLGTVRAQKMAICALVELAQPGCALMRAATSLQGTLDPHRRP